MNTQSKSYGKALKTSKEDGRRSITLNLAHMIFLHSLLQCFPRADFKDATTKQFLSELIFLLEIYIDQSENEKLKNELKYKPTKNAENGI